MGLSKWGKKALSIRGIGEASPAKPGGLARRAPDEGISPLQKTRRAKGMGPNDGKAGRQDDFPWHGRGEKGPCGTSKGK